MLAVVDDGMGFEMVTQPEITCEIAMRRNECGIMIGGFWINAITACRLDGHGDIVIEIDGEMERASVESGI